MAINRRVGDEVVQVHPAEDVVVLEPAAGVRDDLKIGRDYRELKYRTDSLEQQVNYQARYIDGLKKVLKGDVSVKLDTTKINLPREDYSND